LKPFPTQSRTKNSFTEVASNRSQCGCDVYLNMRYQPLLHRQIIRNNLRSTTE
jgi:hypothetical protein